MTCARCSALEEQVAFLQGELGLQQDASDLAAVLALLPSTSARGQVAKVLLALYAAKGRFVTVEQLAERAPSPTGIEDRNDGAAIKVWICNARASIGRDAIRTLRGVGYALSDRGRAVIAEAIAATARG